MDAKAAVPDNQKDLTPGERIMLSAFAALGLTTLAAAIALMGLAMHFLPGY